MSHVFLHRKNNQGQLNCQEESPYPIWYCPEKQHDCVAMSHYVCSWHTPFGLSTVQWECAPALRVPSWNWTVVLCGKQRDGYCNTKDACWKFGLTPFGIVKGYHSLNGSTPQLHKLDRWTEILVLYNVMSEFISPLGWCNISSVGGVCYGTAGMLSGNGWMIDCDLCHRIKCKTILLTSFYQVKLLCFLNFPEWAVLVMLITGWLIWATTLLFFLWTKVL